MPVRRSMLYPALKEVGVEPGVVEPSQPVWIEPYNCLWYTPRLPYSICKERSCDNEVTTGHEIHLVLRRGDIVCRRRLVFPEWYSPHCQYTLSCSLVATLF